MKRSNKKGSMELGVNAIVVLIIALAILGLGIAFVTNLFKSGSEKLGGIIDSSQLSIHGTASEPVKLERTSLTIKKGKIGTVRASVYNDGFATDTELISFPDPDCKDAANNPIDIPAGSPEQKIPVGSDVGYIIGFDTSGSTISEGTYICTLATSTSISGESRSTQLVIEIVI